LPHQPNIMTRGPPCQVCWRKHVGRGLRAIPLKKAPGWKCSEKQNQADAWFDRHPIFHWIGFQIGPHKNNHLLCEVHRQHMCGSVTFGTEFPSHQCKAFCEGLTDVTRNARTPSKIVWPMRSHITGKKRACSSEFICLFALLVCSLF